jgi:two-component system sensor histidine kinase KdpD
LASLGHDLKTPLTAVRVAANNLTASWLTPEQRGEQVDIVLAGLGRLGRLFENLMDMARIEIDAVAVEREWVEPEEIIDAAAGLVEQCLEGHRVEIDNGAAKKLVKLDPRLTTAAVAHLLENAAHYSPPGSQIGVRVAVAPREIRIAVRDHGGGLSAQEVDRLFERFYRGAAASRHQTGTGMGLAITRGLLAAQGGQVWAENAGDGGAVFTVAVPVETREIESIEEEAP